MSRRRAPSGKGIVTLPNRVNDIAPPALIGSSIDSPPKPPRSAKPPGAERGFWAGSSTTTSKRSAGSCSKWWARNAARSVGDTGDCGCSRYSRSRVVRQSSRAAPTSLFESRRTSAYSAAIVRRQSASVSVAPTALGPSSVKAPPLSATPEGADHDDQSDEDEQHRPEAAPADHRHVDPERAIQEVVRADRDEDEPDDHRGEARAAISTTARRKPRRFAPVADGAVRIGPHRRRRRDRRRGRQRSLSGRGRP